MSVLIHSDFLVAISIDNHPAQFIARSAMEERQYERLFTTQGMISQFLCQVAGEGPQERGKAVNTAQALYLRSGLVQRTEFAQFTNALDAYRNEFRDSTLTLEDVIAVLLMRESDSTDILSANTEFRRYGLRPLMA
ncbi:MAG: hypothetical protein OXI41_13345 [Chloroflexota bacterium]|nr:hypothetical protein [Chloroflexota bacterium]MDE2894892.1 hypothetical protein [Chloroflexota bacterium]